MQASVLLLAAVAARFVALSAGAAAFLPKARRTSFLSTASFDEELESSRTGIRERLSRLDSETRAFESWITDVQNAMGPALVQLQGVAEPVKANVSVAQHKIVVNATNAKSVLKDEQGVLANLFKHLKTNIAKFNKKESSDKEKCEKTRQHLEDRLKRDEALLNSKNISTFEHERLLNVTRMDKVELEYWNRDRELQHHMFHSNLKMSHGLMQRVKSVLEAYAQAASKGKVDPAMMKKLVDSSPAKVFLDMREDVQERSQTYRVHLRWGLELARKARKHAAGLV